MNMTLRERYEGITEYFKIHMPAPETELFYGEPFQLVVAVILSAQCTDKRVNMITPALLKRFPDAQTMAKAEPEEVFEYIKSCSYPNNKSKHLVGMARMLVSEFGSVVPSDTSELQRMPGVGRKTANVVASVLYRKPVMAVDTHVFRVAGRIGLTTNSKNPLETELQLTKNFPMELMHQAHHWLIFHGRYVCKARKPLCDECGIKKFCKYYSKKDRLK
jgi:endonuclease-3